MMLMDNCNKIKKSTNAMTIPKLAILEQEMDRKEFLKNVGIGLMLLLGGNMIIGAISSLNRMNGHEKVQSNSYGYGSSRYGR